MQDSHGRTTAGRLAVSYFVAPCFLRISTIWRCASPTSPRAICIWARISMMSTTASRMGEVGTMYPAQQMSLAGLGLEDGRYVAEIWKPVASGGLVERRESKLLPSQSIFLVDGRSGIRVRGKSGKMLAFPRIGVFLGLVDGQRSRSRTAYCGVIEAVAYRRLFVTSHGKCRMSLPT